MRACSYHASPGPGQGNVLWTGLWMIYVNTLVSLSTAVDEGCCGKVDNRCDTGSCQVAGLPRSTGDTKYPQASPRGPLSLAVGGREAVTPVSVAMRKSRCPLMTSATTGGIKPPGGDWDGVGDVHGRAGARGYYQSGHQLAETIA
jgi:hypothetical protein